MLDCLSGSRVHGDVNPMNYLFNHDKVHALDFESSKENAYFGVDLGFVAAELKFFPSIERTEEWQSYIGRFLWQYSRNEPEFHANNISRGKSMSRERSV